MWRAAAGRGRCGSCCPPLPFCGAREIPAQIKPVAREKEPTPSSLKAHRGGVKSAVGCYASRLRVRHSAISVCGAQVRFSAALDYCGVRVTSPQRGFPLAKTRGHPGHRPAKNSSVVILMASVRVPEKLHSVTHRGEQAARLPELRHDHPRPLIQLRDGLAVRRHERASRLPGFSNGFDATGLVRCFSPQLRGMRLREIIRTL